MNAKGVSVFYGATEKDIAISEVRPPVHSHVVVGAFKLIRTLRILDLQQLGSITLNLVSSPFDPSTVEEASRRDFMKTLTRMMVMPVMPELEEQGYLITQAIADFLSTHPKLELDGILFSSAQNTMASHNNSGRNVVLFNKASTVQNAEYFRGKTDVSLWEFYDDSPDHGFKPEIRTKESPKDEEDYNAFMWFGSEPIKPALELDRNAIEIYEINGVEYQKCCHQVKQLIIAPEKTTSG
jgi:RES domain